MSLPIDSDTMSPSNVRADVIRQFHERGDDGMVEVLADLEADELARPPVERAELLGWCQNHWMRARVVSALIALVLGVACTGGAEPAPNLLSPTPTPDADVLASGGCVMFPVRAEPMTDEQLVRGLGAYVPDVASQWLWSRRRLVGIERHRDMD